MASAISGSSGLLIAARKLPFATPYHHHKSLSPLPEKGPHQTCKSACRSNGATGAITSPLFWVTLSSRNPTS
nr:hypothetical protein Itr_chr04CG14830 [Ipomoea trifida]